jgi:YfiH family protein
MTFNYPILSCFPELQHFCTTRHGGASLGNYGTFNISSFSGDNAENQQTNLGLLANQLQISPQQIIFPYQTHSDCVKTINADFLQLSESNKTVYLDGVDALITNLAQVCIGVTTADCVPILIYDKVNKVVAAVHAGWRGTCSRIVQKTIDLMRVTYGTEPENVFASIGISISPDVYSVGEELISEFENNNFPVDDIFCKRDEQFYLDLWAANKWLLMQSRIPENQIEIAGICSFTNSNDYYSARKLGIKSGRMLSGLMLK